MSNTPQPAPTPTPHTAWCSGHQTFEPIERFSRSARRVNGLQGSCKAVVAAYNKEYRKANRDSLATSDRARYKTNRETVLARVKKYRAANLEMVTTRVKAYYETHRTELLAQQKEYNEANAGDVAARHKAYYETHRVAIAAYKKEWSKANQEAIAAAAKLRHDANPGAASARVKAWREANPEQVSANRQKRRALEVNATGSFTAAQLEALYEFYDHRCLCCGQREGDISDKNGKPIKIAADHVIPLACGGSNEIDNIQPLCKPCNSSKGARHATDYRLNWVA